ncbi:cupin domain-containing protein [Thioalkalicoccus limnaeus]|uniref:Cupin domain-containing protein n=1 Tax=Thioalkalicoccus limnaeus TaxID=120681 RepID=A0ABV4BJQ3_9GAMM
MNDTPIIRRARPGFTWEAVEPLVYKPQGSAPFRDITRQVLFRRADLACELRYFEIAPGGYSTLERHEHEHGVMVLNGRGRVLVRDALYRVAAQDLVLIPTRAWHQFRADEDSPLGFLCLVNVERDRPQLPTAEDLAELRRDEAIARFIRP